MVKGFMPIGGSKFQAWSLGCGTHPQRMSSTKMSVTVRGLTLLKLLK